jgi:hypothetical protein
MKEVLHMPALLASIPSLGPDEELLVLGFNDEDTEEDWEDDDEDWDDDDEDWDDDDEDWDDDDWEEDEDWEDEEGDL